MDTGDKKTEYRDDNYPRRYNGRVWGGLFLLVLGGIFLLKEMSFPFFPDWLFTWPMILIGVGIFSAIRHNFRGGGWVIMLLVGGFFLIDESGMGVNIHRYIVPFIIITVGVAMILRPRWNRDDRYWDRHRQRVADRYQRRHWNDWGYGPQGGPYTPPPPPQDFSSGPGVDASAGPASTEDYIDSVSVFGGVRKVIMSKNFKGGEATSFLGGTELDFTQADINGIVVLELTQVMGGAKLIVPGNWTVKNEVNAVFGGVDDKRNLHVAADPNKVLLLKGTSVFGGLEIRNF